MKDYRSSIDRELLRHMKEHSTAEQRMNWWLDALAFVKESRKNWKHAKKPQ